MPPGHPRGNIAHRAALSNGLPISWASQQNLCYELPEMRTAIFLLLLILPLAAELKLPLETSFVGKERFESIRQKASTEEWHRLPIGDRVARIALQFEGTSYKSYTLEIHDRIESPSANLMGMDCWTFFEISLAWARLLEDNHRNYGPSDLLRAIEVTRYRGGQCHGHYLDRLHYLADWYIDNDKRRTIDDLTRKFPYRRMPPQCGEMTRLWKYYRYLRENPELRAGMAEHEKRLNATPVYMIPKAKVAAIEPKLANGDIIGIARNDKGSYCSHVGLIIIDKEGRRRFMHASTDARKVIVDQAISQYLARFKKHAGILVARPN